MPTVHTSWSGHTCTVCQEFECSIIRSHYIQEDQRCPLRMIISDVISAVTWLRCCGLMDTEDTLLMLRFYARWLLPAVCGIQRLVGRVSGLDCWVAIWAGDLYENVVRFFSWQHRCHYRPIDNLKKLLTTVFSIANCQLPCICTTKWLSCTSIRVHVCVCTNVVSSAVSVVEYPPTRYRGVTYLPWPHTTWSA